MSENKQWKAIGLYDDITSTVGQVIKVAEVDENNKPIKYETVNIEIPNELSDLIDDSTHRTVTDTEKATWNAKSNFSGNYNDLTNKPTLGSLASKSTVAKTDLVSDVQTSLDKANTALQSETDPTVPTWAKEPNKPPVIIDAIELPETEIQEDVLYFAYTARPILNQKELSDWKYHFVTVLPEIGEPVTIDMISITAYCNIDENIAYGYVDNALSTQANIPIGWYDFNTLAAAFNVTWGGIITSLADDPCDDKIRALMEHKLFYYTNRWHALRDDNVGVSGGNTGAEIFNNYKNNVASGEYSHAEGSYTTASGECSHAEGYYITASGNYSHAEGYNATASHSGSHAEGWGTTASGAYSHAEGNNTIASSTSAHAEGGDTTAEGVSSHAEGYKTTASGMYSHAEGYDTTASRTGAHAEGEYTIASGEGSHSEGIQSEASAWSSHAEGLGTVANSRAQHSQGEYNILDAIPSKGDNYRGIYVHIVGNGESENARSNAHTLDWNGNAWFAGDVYVGSTSGTNKDDGSKKLATEEFVGTEVAALVGSAPETLDTIEELATALNNNKDIVTVLNDSIATKANKTDVYTKAEVDAAIKAAIDEAFAGIVRAEEVSF